MNITIANIHFKFCNLILKLFRIKLKVKLANLKKHHGTIIGDPEDLVHIDWSHNWNKEKNL
jgi:hypothetical protein